MGDGTKASDMQAFLPVSGCIRHGPGFIYRLWKGMMDEWLCRGGTVFIVSPLIDARRVADILLLLVKHASKSNNCKVKMLCLEQCDGRLNFNKILAIAKNKVLRVKGPNGRRLVRGYRLNYGINDRLEVKHANFHCKLIAHMRSDGIVDILLTSANFHRWHLDVDNGDFVQKITLTMDQFNKNYLQHIGFMATL